jgi:hypothetical protein
MASAHPIHPPRPALLTLLLGLALAVHTPAVAQTGGVLLDTVQAGRFDMGKMWTFEYAPVDYFTTTYGFHANQAWFDAARMAALRIPGCSAAFVSPNGLVVTNHHCVRGSIVRVTREGESLLDHGFYAASLLEERPIPSFYADQLVAAEDVSDEILTAMDRGTSDADRERIRREVMGAIQERLAARHNGGEGTVRVDVTALYNGGRYSAYTFRRYTDVRLVAAAELEVAHFGGDPDNFTYPRYALDFAFLRVYGSDGEPLETDHFFRWSQDGVQEGDVVFVIGNPGPTNRLSTVAQLEFQRDVLVPAQKAFFATRLAAMREFHATQPDETLMTRILSLSNSLKANTGRLEALRDPAIMIRKAAGERSFQQALQSDPELNDRWGGVVQELARIQGEKKALGPQYSAFVRFGPGATESALLSRALYAAQYVLAGTAGVSADTLAALRQQILRVDDLPTGLEEAFLEERLGDFQRYLGPDHPLTEAALEGRTVEGAAASLLARSALATRDRAARALEAGTLDEDDPAVRLGRAILPVYSEFTTRFAALGAREQTLAAELGRARFALYGTDVPPDASSSPRITDGEVIPYEYNGTLAPVYTTFFGLFDRFYSNGPGSDWSLPDRWVPPPSGLDLGTPLNFISTADTYGGNSGSPAVTPALEIVGLNFDRNINGLSRDFIYLPERGRNIMVDVRAILEAMTVVYRGDRVVEEILTHRLVPTEAEAAAGRR